MKIWQAVDKDGAEKTHLTEKPFLYSDMARNKFFGCKETDTALPTFLFPIDLKPLQIAEITVNENGTWSYEIEREEGWYMCYDTGKLSPIVLQWVGGIFKAANGASFTEDWFRCNGWICEDKIESQLLNEIRI